MKQSPGVGRAIVTFAVTDIMQRNAFYTQFARCVGHKPECRTFLGFVLHD